jgi:hypothetical protein
MTKNVAKIKPVICVLLAIFSSCTRPNESKGISEYCYFNEGYQIVEKDSVGRIKAIHTIHEVSNDSIVIDLYENGQVGRYERYIKKLKEGQSTTFYESGELSAQTEYKAGKKHLWSIWYDRNGQISSKEFHIPMDDEAQLGHRLTYDSLGKIEPFYSEYVNLKFDDEFAILEYINPLVKGECALLFLDEHFALDSIGYSLEPFPAKLSLKLVPPNTKYGCMQVAIDTLGRKMSHYLPFEWKEQNHNSLND